MFLLAGTRSASVVAFLAVGIVDDEHFRVLVDVSELILKSVYWEVTRCALRDTRIALQVESFVALSAS